MSGVDTIAEQEYCPTCWTSYLPHDSLQDLADQLWAIKDLRADLVGVWESLKEIDMVISNLETLVAGRELPEPSWKTNNKGES